VLSLESQNHHAIPTGIEPALAKFCEKDAGLVQWSPNGIAERTGAPGRDGLIERLRGLTGRSIFDYSSLDCCIDYNMPVQTRELVASPKVPVEIPTITITSRCRLLRKRLAA